MILFLKRCSEEIKDFPIEVRIELGDALAQLDGGQHLSMPLCRPMPSIGRRVYELRFTDRSGVYRVIYVIKKSKEIWCLHAFQKKTQETSRLNIELAKQRLRGIL